MKLNKVLLYIYLLSILSLFFPITIYPIIFIIFIIIHFIDLLYRRTTQISYNGVLITITSILFIYIASITFFVNYDLSNKLQYVKLIINLTFFSSIYIYIQSNLDLIRKNLNLIKYTLEAIIFLSFLQIVVNVSIMNLWMIPYIGVKDSVEAYKIIQSPIIFGSYEKNIWATKLAFIEIIYFSFYIFRLFQVNKFILNFFIFLSIFNILYTFSRTAQLMFLVFFILLILWKIYLGSSFYKKLFLTATMAFFSFPLGILLYNKLFHITLGTGDGLSARLDIWHAFYINIDNMNWLYGNGILYGAYLIPEFTRWPNNNFHNVFLNTFSDMGIIGLSLYIVYIVIIFFSTKLLYKNKLYFMFVLFIPNFIVINSQYLGYDNDIVIYFSLVALLNNILLQKNMQNR